MLEAIVIAYCLMMTVLAIIGWFCFIMTVMDLGKLRKKINSIVIDELIKNRLLQKHGEPNTTIN